MLYMIYIRFKQHLLDDEIVSFFEYTRLIRQLIYLVELTSECTLCSIMQSNKQAVAPTEDSYSQLPQHCCHLFGCKRFEQNFFLLNFKTRKIKFQAYFKVKINVYLAM